MDGPAAGYLAIDLGPSRLAAGVVDQSGEVVVRDRLATPARNVWPALTQLVRRVMAANPTGVVPRTVGVTCPGPIDRLTGAMKPVGMPTWHDFPIRRELAAVTNLPVGIDTPGQEFECELDEDDEECELDEEDDDECELDDAEDDE